MMPPTNQKEVRKLIGSLNYYPDVWKIYLYILQTLTDLNYSKMKFKWEDVEHKSFKDTKRSLYRNNLLSYPYFNKQFDIHTYARNLQLRMSL